MEILLIPNKAEMHSSLSFYRQDNFAATLEELVYNSPTFVYTLENIIAQWLLYHFQQCRKAFQVKVHIALEQKIKIPDIFRLIQGLFGKK